MRRYVTSPTGLLRNPSNTQADLRDVFARLGYPWVTSHVFRKTAATLLDGAGVSARKIADQSGHVQVSLTQDSYMGRKIASEDGGGAVLAADPAADKVLLNESQASAPAPDAEPSRGEQSVIEEKDG